MSYSCNSFMCNMALAVLSFVVIYGFANAFHLDDTFTASALSFAFVYLYWVDDIHLVQYAGFLIGVLATLYIFQLLK